MDDKVPASPLEKLVFKKFMYSQQDRLEEQMRKLGLTSDDDYTCTCYLPQVGNIPKRGWLRVSSIASAAASASISIACTCW